MPRKKPPSEELFARAAELRAAGVTWETIAKEVNRAVRTVYYWPRKYPKLWADALLQAERDMNSQSDSEAVRGLRGLLMSQDEKIRWHAAKSLIVRRIERDKIELKSPPPKRPSAPKRPSSSLSSMDYPMKNSPTASPQCPPPPNSPTPLKRRLLEVGPSGQTAPPQPELLHPARLERFIAVGCNGAGSTGTRADLLVRDDVVDASALHGHAERCRVAACFENNP